MSDKTLKFILKLYGIIALITGFSFAIAAIGSLEQNSITELSCILYGFGGLLVAFSGAVILNIISRN